MIPISDGASNERCLRVQRPRRGGKKGEESLFPPHPEGMDGWMDGWMDDRFLGVREMKLLSVKKRIGASASLLFATTVKVVAWTPFLHRCNFRWMHFQILWVPERERAKKRCTFEAISANFSRRCCAASLDEVLLLMLARLRRSLFCALTHALSAGH